MANLVSSQDNVECTLDVTQELLVRCGSPSFEVGDYGGCGVDLGCKILLCHGSALVVFGFTASLGNGLPDNCADSLGLDDVVGTVDLGEALAFAGATGVASGKLLLSANVAASFRGVESRLSLDDRLPWTTSAPTSLAADLGDGVPLFTHF